MSLLDEVQATTVLGRGPLCSVGAWTASLDETTQAEVDEVMRSGYTNTAIRTVLASHWSDLPFNVGTIARHRRAVRGIEGGCRCRS